MIMHFKRTIVILLFILIPRHSAADNRTVLHIGGIFPLTLDGGGWPGGQSCLPAVQMALEDVNAMNVVPGYTLQLHWKDSACQPGLGARVMYELLYTEPKKLVLLSGCSLVTTVVAEAAHMWSLMVLSYGASSPALSNRQRFPTLFRTHPSATIHNPTRVELFNQFHWKKVAIVQVAEEVFTETAKDLERECVRLGIDIVSHQSFIGDPSDALKSLKRQDARIIVGLFYEKVARRVFCQIYKEGLYGRRYVWFLIGWYSDTWFHPQENEGLNCTKEQMTEAVQYHLTTEAMMLNPYEQPGKSGQTGNQFQRKLIKRLQAENNNITEAEVRNLGGFVEAPLAYDAIWALALALNCSKNELLKEGKRLENFSYEKGSEVLTSIIQCMKETNFEGVSGTVSFSDKGDRIAQTQIEQLQDGRYCKAYTFDSTESNLQLLTLTNDAGVCQKVKWFSDKPPRDAPLMIYTPITTDKSLFIGFGFITLITACMCTAAGIFNWENKMNRVIAHSQVQVNNLFVFGCLLAVISVFLWGLPVEGVDITKRTFAMMCHARVMLLSFGFTLCVGAMFSKVWIVYRFGAGDEDKRSIAKQKSFATSFSSRFASVRSQVRAFRTPMLAAGLLANSQAHVMLAARLVANKVLFQCVVRSGNGIKLYVVDKAQRQIPIIITLSLVIGRPKCQIVVPLMACAFLHCPASRRLLLFIFQFRLICGRTVSGVPIPVAKFYVIVGLLTFVDFCIHAAWMEFDTMRQHEKNFSVIDDPTKDQLIKPYIESCQSRDLNLWTGLVLAPKGVLLLISVFIAYESRNLRLRYINDSGMISLAVYNVTVLGLVTVPILLFLIHDQPDARFGFIAIAVLACVIISLALVFMPKIVQIWQFGKLQQTRAKQSLAVGTKSLVDPVSQLGGKRNDKSEQNFKRLSCEIDDMRKKIAVKDARIADLRHRINRARAERASDASTEPNSRSVDGDNLRSPTSSTSNNNFSGNNNNNNDNNDHNHNNSNHTTNNNRNNNNNSGSMPNSFAAVVVHKSSNSSSLVSRHKSSTPPKVTTTTTTTAIVTRPDRWSPEDEGCQHENASSGANDSGIPSSNADQSAAIGGTAVKASTSGFDWTFTDDDKETVV